MINHQLPTNPPELLQNKPGFNPKNFVTAHQNMPALTTIRLNPLKKTNIKVGTGVPWCPQGFYLDEYPPFNLDPLFHAGAYYIQEASSMFIGHIVQHIKQQEPVKILDLCAAPGGKSTLLNSAMNIDDLLVANEIVKTRVPVLADNLTRWGTSNTIVTNNDPKDFERLPGFFDIVLVDAPCSGSGMLSKEPGEMADLSEANSNLYHQRQERILTDVYSALKEEGYLIYSTCSYSHQENEDILDWLCEQFNMESIRIPINKEWGIVETQSATKEAWGYHIYTDIVKGEGLFAACLRKKEETDNLAAFKINNNQKVDKQELELVRNYITNPTGFYFFKVNDDWVAINNQHKESLNLLSHRLNIKKSGVIVGKVAGRDMVPHHELALSTIINKEVVLQTELSYDDAIQYLRKENISIDTAQKGWSLMTFDGLPLGWAKLLPNRINNYYPKELRILSQPSQPPKRGV